MLVQLTVYSFFAKSWRNPQLIDLDSIRSSFYEKLAMLSKSLPSRFSETVRQLIDEVPLLFSGTYPLVLTHGDLCEMNLLVQPENGRLTGIIDWAEAETLPFGLALWGLENVLGFMDSQGWSYFDGHAELKDLFWMTFETDVGGITDDERRAIGIARNVGIFFRYGFCWEDHMHPRVVTEADSTIKYLDGLVTNMQ